MNVRPVHRSDRPAVVDLLVSSFPAVPPDRWDVLFDYGFVGEPPDFGLLVEDDGQVVAFFHVLYSDRTVRGQRARFACLNSWCVRADRRGRGVGRLLADAMLAHMEEMDVPALGLTMGPEAMTYFRKRGARPFRSFRQVRYAVPPLLRRPRMEWVDLDSIGPEAIGQEQHRIMTDHRTLNCNVRALQAAGRVCVVISRRRALEIDRPAWLRRIASGPQKGGGRPTRWLNRARDLLAGVVVCSEVLHVSDRDLFRRHRRQATFLLAVADRAAAVCGDHELLGLAWPPRDEALTDYLYRGLPEGLGPEDLDVLYSELVVLDTR